MIKQGRYFSDLTKGVSFDRVFKGRVPSANENQKVLIQLKRKAIQSFQLKSEIDFQA